MILLFWILKGIVRCSRIEIDLCGRATLGRESLIWHACFGEIKSSEGLTLQKGKKQLNFMDEVCWSLLQVATDGFAFNLVKALFIVNSDQSKRKLISLEDGILMIDVRQLF